MTRQEHTNHDMQHSRVIDSTLETHDNTLDRLGNADTSELSDLVNPLPSLDVSTNLTLNDLPRRPGTNMTDEQRLQVQALFLEEFKKRANLSAACRIAGIHRSLIYYWLEHDTGFAEKYIDAEKTANDTLLDEAWRRGHDGTLEPVVSMGKLVRNDDGSPLTVAKYDTPLLMMLIRTRMPEYRESKNVDMQQTTTINTSHTLSIDVRGMSQEELATLRQLAEGVKSREQARIEKTSKESGE